MRTPKTFYFNLILRKLRSEQFTKYSRGEIEVVNTN